MASPIPKLPKVIKNLNLLNYTDQAGREQIRIEIMRETGAMKENTITEIIKAMSDLGYIRDSGHGGIFYLCKEGKPYNFPQIKENIAGKEADNLLEKLSGSNEPLVTPRPKERGITGGHHIKE